MLRTRGPSWLSISQYVLYLDPRYPIAFGSLPDSLPYFNPLCGSTGKPTIGWLTSCGQVQSGGSFDVDYSVVGPTDKVILDGTKERQGDFVFTANDVGEYRFCFNNEMSTFAEKMVDFEIAVRTASHCIHGPV
jgi:hypothetical protein